MNWNFVAIDGVIKNQLVYSFKYHVNRLEIETVLRLSDGVICTTHKLRELKNFIGWMIY
jgi:hypothetical protein